jgi:hypothetical protein
VIKGKSKYYYRVFAPGVPNIRVVSERFTSEADAKRLKGEILNGVSSRYGSDRKDG